MNLNPRYVAMAGLVLGTLSWAGNALIARASAGMLPPVGLSFWRWTTALLLLLPFTAVGLWRHRYALLQYRWQVLVLAALSITTYNTLLYLAAQSTTAINITLVNTGLPVAAFIWTLVIVHELPTRATVFGALLSFCGLLVVLTNGQPQSLLGLRFNPGDLIMVVAVLAWGLYSVLLRRWMLPVPGLVQLAALLLCGLPLLLPFFVWEYSITGPMPLTLHAAGAIAYTAIMASLVAYLAWNNGVKVLGPGTASLFSYLMPVFTALLGVLLLGEVLRWYHLVGGALTFFGLVLATWEGRKR